MVMTLLAKDNLDRSISAGSFQTIEALRETVVEESSQSPFADTAEFEIAEVRVKSQNSGETLVALVLRNAHRTIFRVLQASQQSASRNFGFPLNSDVPMRVLEAWKMGAEQELIAYAVSSEKGLTVLDCALYIWTIPFEVMPALQKIPPDQRQHFELDSDGSFLYWESTDTHIDLESLRASIDPELKAKLNAEKVLHDKRFGKAIASVRKSLKLKQTDIGTVSAKQISRIEKGARPKLETLKLLAQAHGLEINDYLEKVAQAIAALS
jgi:Helix-turn-helix